MPRYNFTMPERYKDILRVLADTTGLPESEILRRMIDFCSDHRVVDELVPTVSGSVRLSV